MFHSIEQSTSDLHYYILKYDYDLENIIEIKHWLPLQIQVGSVAQKMESRVVIEDKHNQAVSVMRMSETPNGIIEFEYQNNSPATHFIR